jgi:hypothetical protein
LGGILEGVEESKGGGTLCGLVPGAAGRGEESRHRIDVDAFLGQELSERFDCEVVLTDVTLDGVGFQILIENLWNAKRYGDSRLRHDDGTSKTKRVVLVLCYSSAVKL